MQTSLQRSQASTTQKVKNILTRSLPADKCNNDRKKNRPDKLEASYILKYSPKYYQNLAIEIKPYSPLLSKIKKIKKLKKLKGWTGESFQKTLPANLWFNLLMNSRKDMEQPPEMFPKSYASIHLVGPSPSFWRMLSLQKITLFPNLKSVMWRLGDPHELFVKYFWNLRKLRNLNIRMLIMGDGRFEGIKWLFERLDTMPKFIGKLEALSIDAEVKEDVNIGELFQNKQLFSHVTGLRLSVPFDPIFAEIPQICKNLKALSLEFTQRANNPKFRSLLTSMQDLKQLESLRLTWPEEASKIWSYFKPQASLRKLDIDFNVSHLIKEGLFGKKKTEPKDVVGHWEEIPELDVLGFCVSNDADKKVRYVKDFITMILKKVQKLGSFRYMMTNSEIFDEPFFAEEVPHLYDSLESFEIYQSNWYCPQEKAKIDLKMLKPFRKLKELKLDGYKITYTNVEKIVSIMQKNHKDNEKAPVLKIKILSMPDENWLGETLKKIACIYRFDKPLEILIDLNFSTNNLIGFLQKFCGDLEAVKRMKGLVMNLEISSGPDVPLVDRIRAVLETYPEIKGLKITISNRSGVFVYKKMQGQRMEFSRVIH